MIDADGTYASGKVTVEVEGPSGLRITSLELREGESGQPYADTLTATGGSPPYTFLWPRIYEHELTLDVATGAVSGIPGYPTGPNGEPVEVEVRVQDVVGASALARARFGIRPGPLTIVDALPDGQVNVRYLCDLQAEGGFSPQTWSVAAGTLPP